MGIVGCVGSGKVTFFILVVLSSQGRVTAACDKRGSNTFFTGPHFISPSSIFPVGHHILDDPFSVVDAYVGKAILENCLRMLCTFLIRRITSMSWTVVIIEQGKYKVSSSFVVCRRSPNRMQDLTANSVVFSHAIKRPCI